MEKLINVKFIISINSINEFNVRSNDLIKSIVLWSLRWPIKLYRLLILIIRFNGLIITASNPLIIIKSIGVIN